MTQADLLSRIGSHTKTLEDHFSHNLILEEVFLWFY
jgi:hypothetical protein